MDEEPQLDARARRAIPLIAAALTVIVVAGLIYLRANAPPSPGVLVGTPPVPQLASGYWASYDFITPSLGWAGIVRQAGVPTIWVFRTTDGARHWQKELNAEISQGQPPSIQFFDREHGIFYAGRLYRTVDGGAHWNAISLPGSTPVFTFAGPTRGWALAYDGASTSNLYSTVDGGLTWKLLGATVPPEARGLRNEGPSTFDFRTDGEGWIGAELATPVVYSTADGGMSWHATTIPVPKSPQTGMPDNYSTSIALLPGNGVIAQVVNGFGSELGFTSLDRGGSWRQIQEPPGPATFGDLSFLDARQWWASRWGKLFKTFDAGQTWTEVRVIAADIFNDWTFGTAQVIDSRHAWFKMTGSTAQYASIALAMTSDGGFHWTAVNVPQPV